MPNQTSGETIPFSAQRTSQIQQQPSNCSALIRQNEVITRIEQYTKQPSISADGLAALATLGQLTNLRLDGCRQLTGQGLAALAVSQVLPPALTPDPTSAAHQTQLSNELAGWPVSSQLLLSPRSSLPDVSSLNRDSQHWLFHICSVGHMTHNTAHIG